MDKSLKTVALNDLVPYENNPRLNDQAVDAVAESIKQCEYIAPIIVDEDMVILAGHTRTKALEKMGADTVEVMQVSGLSEAQKRKYRLLDNKTNELAMWDFDKLDLELADLEFDGYDFGFDIEIDEFDEADLDADEEKSKVNVSIVFDSYFDFEQAKERLENIADEANVSLSIKMV